MAIVKIGGLEFKIENMPDWLNLPRNIKSEISYGIDRKNFRDFITIREGGKEKTIVVRQDDPNEIIQVFPQTPEYIGKEQYTLPNIRVPQKMTLRRYYEKQDQYHQRGLDDMNGYLAKKRALEKKYSKGDVVFGSSMVH